MAPRTDEMVDTDMVREMPPIRLMENRKPILHNIANIKKKADGDWYRVARFDIRGGASTLARSLRDRRDMERVEFKSYTLVREDDGYEDGYRSALYCRWIGAPGQPGKTEKDAPRLAVVPSVDDAAEREEPPARRRRSR